MTFTATAAGTIASNQTATLTATINGSTQAAAISLVAPVLVTGLTCSPASLGPSASATCTVTVSQAAGGTVAVSSNEEALTAPASFTVAAGSLTATFTATAAGTIAGNQTATLTATINGSAQTAGVSLVAPVLVTGLTCSPASLGPGASATCTVTVSQAAGGTVAVSSNAAALMAPASFTVAAGSLTATFTATAAGTIAGNQSATLTATINGSTQTAAVSLIAVTVTLNPPTTTAQNQGTQQFVAIVTGSSNTAITWSVSPAIGSISSSGLYTAPQFVNSPSVVTVMATSAADPTKYASAQVSLQPVGLVGYWPFDETSGVTAHDASGSGNDATLGCTGACSKLANWSPGVRNEG